jgi:Domain of Unknown Function (DUF1206)
MGNTSSTALEFFARWGYTARGVVYCLVGGLSLLAAFGRTDGPPGITGALETLLPQPVGTALLLFIALGLIGLGLWRLVQAIFDPDRNGNSWSAIGTRCGYVISSAIYFGLAATGFDLVFHGGSRSDDGQAQDWTAWLMSQPYGRWVTAAVAVAVGVAGVVFVIEAWRGGQMAKHVHAGRIGDEWVGLLARTGYAAVGVVSWIVAALLLTAAWHSSPADARGVGGALATLEAQPYGSALLAVVAAGLLAYGAFGIVEGIYRRLDPPSLRDVENDLSEAVTRHPGERSARQSIFF